MTQTATTTPEAEEAHNADPANPLTHDPLNDIDGMKTTLAVVGTLAFIVFLIWAMTHLFNVMVQVERQTKIGDIKPIQLQETRKIENTELSGQNPNRGKMTIDQAIEAYLKK